MRGHRTLRSAQLWLLLRFGPVGSPNASAAPGDNAESSDFPAGQLPRVLVTPLHAAATALPPPRVDAHRPGVRGPGVRGDPRLRDHWGGGPGLRGVHLPSRSARSPRSLHRSPRAMATGRAPFSAARDPRVAGPFRPGHLRRAVRSTGCMPARGQTLGPAYYAKCRTNSCISSREMSPLANAAYTCCSMGMSTAAAPTQARVNHRRSRRDSPGQFQSSPKTESTTPCDRYGDIGGGASDTMTSR